MFQNVIDLQNCSVEANPKQIQKELMEGRYKFRFQEGMKNSEKIKKMANDPLAFYLYKKRHYVTKIPQVVGHKSDEAKEIKLMKDLLVSVIHDQMILSSDEEDMEVAANRVYGRNLPSLPSNSITTDSSEEFIRLENDEDQLMTLSAVSEE